MTQSQNRLGVKLAEIPSLKGIFTEVNEVKIELMRLKK
jgi:hypothetical protein